MLLQQRLSPAEVSSNSTEVNISYVTEFGILKLHLHRFVSVVCFLWVLVVSAFAEDPTSPVSEPSPDPTAAEVMKAVHDSRHVWKDFRGFTAEVEVSTDNARHQGDIVVAADGKYSLNLPDSSSHPWLNRKLESVVGHRQLEPAPEYRVVFADNDLMHCRGRLIKDLTDDSQFRIQDKTMTEVHRRSDKSWFTVTTLLVQKCEEGSHLPRMTSVTYRDPTTGHIESNRANTFEWIAVGPYFLPQRTLTVVTANDGSHQTQELTFNRHQLTR